MRFKSILVAFMFLQVAVCAWQSLMLRKVVQNDNSIARNVNLIRFHLNGRAPDGKCR